jgi:cysteine desulfuration protein SufE
MQTIDSSTNLESSSLEKKISYIQKKFEKLETQGQKYHLLMDFGKELPSIDVKYKTDAHLVQGCQSKLYLHATKRDGKIFFTASSDSLISAGLASLLIEVYNGESLEIILNKPPQFLQTLGIYASLSPNRAHGVAHIYLKMKMLSILLPSENLTP